jgi:hypothetical protein
MLFMLLISQFWCHFQGWSFFKFTAKNNKVERICSHCHNKSSLYLTHLSFKMTEQSIADKEYLETMKERIFEWCCDQFLDSGKQKIKLSDCKEAFMTIHPNLMVKVFTSLISDGCIELDASSGRTIIYNIFTPKLVTFCANRKSIELPEQVLNTHVSPEITESKSIKRKIEVISKVNLSKPHVKTVRIVKDKTYQDISTDISQSISNQSTITTWGGTSPVKTVSKVSVSVVDHLMGVLNAAFKRSGQESLTQTELKQLIAEAAGQLEVNDEQLSLALEQLSGEDKIMCYDDEIYRV